jgi:dTDP-4-dehydrorhamnose 3,5-epimerase
MFNLNSTKIPGCYEIQPRLLDDTRGRFVKIFNRTAFAELGLEVNFAEEYYSVSRQGVVRGMHFQIPPMDHVKIVYCVRGDIFDVVVDLRLGSPSYGKAVTFNLSAAKGNYVYIPRGLAHGFCATTESATLVYKVSTVYSPENDMGILWDSIGVTWPTCAPKLSDRDHGFIPFSAFRSSFVYE